MRWHCPPDTGFEIWRSEAEHAPYRSGGLPTKLNLYELVGNFFFFFLKLECQSEGTNELRSYDKWSGLFSVRVGLLLAHVYDTGSTVNQRCVKASCLLGWHTVIRLYHAQRFLSLPQIRCISLIWPVSSCRIPEYLSLLLILYFVIDTNLAWGTIGALEYPKCTTRNHMKNNNLRLHMPVF